MFLTSVAALTTGSALIYFGNDLNLFQKIEAATTVVKDKNDSKFVPPKRNDLPTYKLEEIKKHGKNSGRIWVIYKNVRNYFLLV